MAMSTLAPSCGEPAGITLPLTQTASPSSSSITQEVAQGAGAYATADESELAASVLHHVLPDWPDSVVVKFLEVAPDFRAFGAQGDVTQLKVLGQKDRPLFYQAG